MFATDPLRLTPPHATGSTGVACVGCGRIHGPDQLIPLAGHPVCIDCKPRRLQCLREGIPNAGIRVAVGIHTDNDLLVIHRGAVAPARCVRCNQPSTWNAQRRYAWHPPWVFLSLLLTPLALIPIASLFSRWAVFNLHLCDRHRRRQRTRIVLAWLWGLGGLALFLGVFLLAVRGLNPLASICLMLSAVISMLMAPLYGQRIHGVLFVKRIEPDGTLHLRGAHPDYLASLSQPLTPNGWVGSADC